MAEAGKLVTFDIVANETDTGYGYINRGDAHDPSFDVENFEEKPTLEVAKQYISLG